MDNITFIKSYFHESIEVKKKIFDDDNILKAINDAVDAIVAAYGNNRKVLIAGNGGSASDSQHITAEFVSRFYIERQGLPAIALNTDTSVITAIANDYGFEKLFARQLQVQGNPGDVFIGITTSGKSKNILLAMEEAQKQKIFSIALTGRNGLLSTSADIEIRVPSDSTPNIQEAHIVIGHCICAAVEKLIFP